MLATSLLCCVLAMLPDDSAQRIPVPEAIALERRTLRARRAIACGEVEYRVVRRLDSGKIEQEFEYRTVFDGQRIRCDVSCRLPALSNAGDDAASSVVRRCVYTKDALFRYIKVNSPGGSSKVVYKREPNVRDLALFWRDRIDPRLIGVVPADPLVLHGASLESFLGLSDRRNTSVERQRVADLETWRIECECSDRSRRRMWIAPSQNYSIVRAIIVPGSGGGSLLDRIECENREYGSPGVWYPRRVCYERFVDGKFYYEVVLTVQKARFNQPVDEAVFTLAGMDIPEGTRVIGLSGLGQGPEMWDGSSIVPLRMHDPPGDLDGERPSGRNPFRRPTSSIALLLVALLALLVRRRKRRARTRRRKTAPV